MGDSSMDKILQWATFTEVQKLRLLIEWFDTKPDNSGSKAASEEAVEVFLSISTARTCCANISIYKAFLPIVPFWFEVRGVAQWY